MNELQQVLLIFAIIVVAALYLLQRRKNKQTVEKNPSNEQEAEKQKANHTLNDLGEAHIPVSSETEHRLGLDDQEQEKEDSNVAVEKPAKAEEHHPNIPDSQLGFSFAEEETTDLSEDSPKKSKHIVIEDTDMMPVSSYESTGKVPTEPEDIPSFGIPQDQPPASANLNQTDKQADKTEPELFVIIVMGTEEYPWPKVNQTLQGVGLKPSDQSIFVKHDSMGNEIIKAANLLEPGTFPIDEPTNSEFKTPGVVLILELPTTVKAPAVMHDMIMMARKISQRLNGRMYNAERQLIKESDLQQMRDAAVAYESKAL